MAAAVVVLSLSLAEAVARLDRVFRWVCREGGRVGEGVVAAAGRVEREERSSSASEERGVFAFGTSRGLQRRTDEKAHLGKTRNCVSTRGNTLTAFISFL